MARRRGRGTVVVDLVEVSGGPATGGTGTVRAAGASGATGDETARPAADAALPPARPGLARRQRLAQAAVAVGVIVVVGGTLAVTGAVRAHARVERLSHAPGGLLSLDRPPQPVWTATSDLSAGLQYLPGVVVQRRSDALVGLDAGSGAERWRVPFAGTPAACGVQDDRGSVDLVRDRLVCVRSTAEATQPVAEVTTWSVLVLGSSGLVGERDVTGPFDAIWPTADGGLLTVRLVGPDPEPVPVTQDGANGWAAGPVEHGYDASVHAEDAVTGESRWDVTVPFRPVDDPTATGACFRADAAGTPRFGPTTLSTRGDSAVFVLAGCGLLATVTRDGVALDDTDPADPAQSAGAFASYVPYADGGVLGTVYSSVGPLGIARTVLRDTSGATVQTFDDQLLDPMATDGTDTGLRLVTSASQLRAVEADGTVWWTAATAASALLVRAGGVAVVEDPVRVLHGIDLDTGEVLWTSRDVLPPDGGVSAVTDGRTALVATSPSDPRATTVDLLALDLVTGEVRWRDEVDGADTALQAVAGRLVEVTPTDITWETSDNGSWATPHGQRVSVLR